MLAIVILTAAGLLDIVAVALLKFRPLKRAFFALVSHPGATSYCGLSEKHPVFAYINTIIGRERGRKAVNTGL